MSDSESFDDFTVHTVPSTLLEDYLSGRPVMSSTTHAPVTRPQFHSLYAMQHESHHNAGYVVRLVWRRP